MTGQKLIAPPSAGKDGTPETGSDQTAPGLLDRTWTNLRGVWRDIANSTLGVVGTLRVAGGRTPEDQWRVQMTACLEGRGGEVSARARAADLGRTYLSLDADMRRRFLRVLARDFDVDRQEVDRAVTVFRDAQDLVARGAAERALRRALEPGRMKLLMQFNILPEGVRFLVEMRAELLDLARDEPVFEALEADLRGLLRSWFDVGFLELRRITWDSPASLLEKVIRYEAVHDIQGWDDLKNRLDQDRRCFAFTHPRMRDEPLIFVEVALVKGMAGEIQALLDQSAPVMDPADADTAIFYSISNTQRGLAGISFGNFLIKRVVDELRLELPNLKRFATLSPIPGFRRWVEEELARPGDGIVGQDDRDRLVCLSGGRAAGTEPGRPVHDEDWIRNPELESVVKPILTRLCSIYLLTAKDRGRAADPVAHFHLSNGARVERLNWLADQSAKGLRQSFGMMVNYAYRLSDIESNHEAYRGDGTVVASSALKALLKPGG